MAEMEDDFMTEFQDLRQIITKGGSNDSAPNKILETNEYADGSGRWLFPSIKSHFGCGMADFGRRNK